ncbi:MAG: hypothetical protein ACTSSE_13685 [Candidatus Thorarchaeota archaeon]
MSNVLPGAKKPRKTVDSEEQTQIYTSLLFELNLKAQDVVREFSLHDIDDKEGIELKRIAMHQAFTELYDTIASFSQQIMVGDFDMAYLRNRVAQSEGETKQQLEAALEELEDQIEKNLADVWMARVMAWLHQAAAASGPFVENEHDDINRNASKYLAKVYTMLERPFAAIAKKVDGTQKLRRVALGLQAYNLLTESLDKDDAELTAILGKNKTAEAEFYDEFLNELIGQESTFRQAFNPFDELIWRDILSSFIFEQATDLYNESIPLFKKNRTNKEKLSTIKSWKSNTAGLSEVYLAMTYTDIADAQMRSGNLEDASKLYMIASDAFGRAEKCFREVLALQPNAEQSRIDKEQKKAQSLFCSAESNVLVLTDLLEVNNKPEAKKVLKEIFKNLKKAEKLAKTRELTGAIQGDLKTYNFVQDLLKKRGDDDIRGIIAQIEFAKDLRKTSLIQEISKAMDEARVEMSQNPSDSLESIREGLNTLGILLSLEIEDEEVGELRNKTLALLNNIKYMVQFQQSSQLQQGVKFILSRILENLHAEEAASYYKIIGDKASAMELIDLGKLALATAFAAEAQSYSRQSEQLAFRAQVERLNTFQKLQDELAILEDDDDNPMENALEIHDGTINKLKHTVASFEAAANELDSVKGEIIRLKNNVDAQVKQLQGVVMKFKGDLSRLEGAKNDFMAEYLFMKGERSKAKIHYSDANDQLREAVGNYTAAAQVFQQVGDAQSAQNVDTKAKTADLLARSIWDNRQRIDRDQEPSVKGETELAALYLGAGDQ